MLSPEQIEEAGERVAAVYREIEARMLDHLARAMAEGWGKSPRTVTEAALLAQSQAGELRRMVEEFRPSIDAAVLEVVEGCLEASDEDDVARAGGSPMWPAQIDATVRGMAEVLARDNVQMAEGAKQAFLNASIEAVTRVNSGDADRESALHRAVRKLERDGIDIITYQDASTGRVTVRNKADVAVRRHVRTQIVQDAQRMTMARMERLGIDLVEVSSHSDARESHAEWQGQCYSLKGEQVIDGVRYPDFYLHCMSGDLGDILGGVNCRHSYGPYRHGAPRMYEPDPQHPSGLPGAEVYELEQGQRYRERKIREAKRELRGARMLYERDKSAANLDAMNKARQKLSRRQEKMREYIDGANAKSRTGKPVLHRKPDREWAGDMPKSKMPASANRTLPQLLGTPSARRAMAGLDKKAVAAAVGEEMARRGGTVAHFRSLSPGDQQGVLRGAIAGLRTNSPEKPRPLAASRISSDGRSQAMYSAILEAKMAGASMGEDEHLRRWKAEGVTNEQRTALYDRVNGYIKSSNSFGINRYLRGLSQELDSASRGTVDLLTKLTTRAQLEEDTTFTRFAGGTDGTGTGGYIRDVLGLTSEEFTGADAVTLDRKLVGRDITDKAFVSVSSNAGKNVFVGMDVCLIIRAKKGAHVMFTDNVNESEAIFAPGTPMTITAVKALDYEKGQAKLTKMIIEVSAG
ncbi:phage minor capsid protein [Adlercreutzia muris]|uniref:phage minor capsid protein n=1 Tax=Adlercreutzia muris TaxID=1796610 RepID=UPI0021D5E677|nr:phage minor capsid protein [Adlercreutzia muris]